MREAWTDGAISICTSIIVPTYHTKSSLRNSPPERPSLAVMSMLPVLWFAQLSWRGRGRTQVLCTCRYRTNRDKFTKLRAEQVKALDAASNSRGCQFARAYEEQL